MFKRILLLLFLWLLLSLWWYLAAPSVLNIKYNPSIDLKELKEPHLIIASHYYNTADAIIMCNESRKTQKTINIVSEYEITNFGSLFNQFWKSFPIYTSYRKLNLYKNQKNNLVNRSIDYLNKQEHILIFLGKDKKSKGIYHILKKKKVPILFVKIYDKKQDLKERRKDNNNLMRLYGSEFNVDYNIVKDYDIDKEPEEFMKWIKNNIYD